MQLDVSVSCVRNIKRYLTLERRMQNYSKNNIKKQPQEEARNKREMTAKPRGDYCLVSQTSSALLCMIAGNSSEVPLGPYCRSVKWKKVVAFFFQSHPLCGVERWEYSSLCLSGAFVTFPFCWRLLAGLGSLVLLRVKSHQNCGLKPQWKMGSRSRASTYQGRIEKMSRNCSGREQIT